MVAVRGVVRVWATILAPLGVNNMELKELLHIELLKDLREAKKELPLLEVASILRGVYKKEELEIIAKEIIQ